MKKSILERKYNDAYMKNTYIIMPVFILLSAGISFAIPYNLPLQGQLFDSSGTAVTVSSDFIFTIFDSGNASLLSSIQALTPDSRGVWSTNISTGLSFNDTYHLQITVNNENMSNNMTFNSIPYAYRAATADNISIQNITGSTSANCTSADKVNNVTITDGVLSVVCATDQTGASSPVTTLPASNITNGTFPSGGFVIPGGSQDNVFAVNNSIFVNGSSGALVIGDYGSGTAKKALYFKSPQNNGVIFIVRRSNDTNILFRYLESASGAAQYEIRNELNAQSIMLQGVTDATNWINNGGNFVINSTTGNSLLYVKKGTPETFVPNTPNTWVAAGLDSGTATVNTAVGIRFIVSSAASHASPGIAGIAGPLGGGGGGDGGLVFMTATGNTIYERMRIIDTGFVGINKSTPSSTLDVGGNVNASAYLTNGTDYAESVPKNNSAENLTSGDIVGIFKGKATKITTGADSWMIVSGTSAGIIGGSTAGLIEDILINQTTWNETTYNITQQRFKKDFTNSMNVPIAFAGQIRAKINDSVTAGDWIIPSNNNDGYGQAVDIEAAPNLATALSWVKKKIGTAWETNTTVGVKYINIKVGF